MYLVLRPPWAGHATTTTDAGVVATAPADAGKPKKKPGGGTRPRHHDPGVPSAPAGSDDPGGEETEPPALVLTAGDRALEWRGDDVTLPPQKIDVGGGGEARGLEQGEIDSTIGSQAGGIKDCVVAGATNTDLRATITVKLLVDGTGHVTRTKVQAPHYLHEHGLLGCTQRAASHMKFPATGAGTVVTLPVNLG